MVVCEGGVHLLKKIGTHLSDARSIGRQHWILKFDLSLLHVVLYHPSHFPDSLIPVGLLRIRSRDGGDQHHIYIFKRVVLKIDIQFVLREAARKHG